ncbi:MAG TPA: hypothetical protein VKM72_16150 [Thermoanaerobaculia bacterium]|nr:hypothetical protein [Thermoanaerobaculia bacterium]
MKDDALLTWEGFAEELEEAVPGGVSAPPVRLASPPADREAILTQTGPARLGVYLLVRACVNDFERMAPWKLLYYPPEDPAELLGMVSALLDKIRGVPKRVDAVLHTLPSDEVAADDEPTRDDVSFLFRGIHHMVANDLKRLETALTPLRSGLGALPTPAEGTHLCEIAADLKGKYSSAMMGAAASLVGQGLYDGVELEPVLFPEKAEEFQSTRELVERLRAATEAIQKLSSHLSFPELLERWRRQERVDLYALAELPNLRAKLGKLLQEKNRRALYSGDYHQISRREMLLSARISELERLHLQTWTTPRDSEDLSAIYAGMVQLVLEISAILDANLLKELIGEKQVNGLRGRAVMAKGKPFTPVTGADALVPLLAEDDLRIYFELLLGAVLRRACLSVRPVETLPPAAPPSLKPEAVPAAAPMPPKPAAAPRPAPVPAKPIDQKAALKQIDALLVELMSPTNPNLSAFKMTQRLLAKHARIPDTMFQSLFPYLEEVRDKLVPALRPIVPYQGITEDVVSRLETFCNDLLRADPASGKEDLPKKMERLPRFLEAVRSVVPHG